MLETLQIQKASTDSLFNQHRDELIVLAKLTDTNEPKIIEAGMFPGNVETTFNILTDSLGQILRISELPYSESGDWLIVFSHYFDTDGKTFAFERQTNFFNSICTEGLAFETRSEFYTVDFQVLDKNYKLVDEKNIPLEKDNCQLPYDYNYEISPGVKTYLLAKKIRMQQLTR